MTLASNTGTYWSTGATRLNYTLCKSEYKAAYMDFLYMKYSVIYDNSITRGH